MQTLTQNKRYTIKTHQSSEWISVHKDDKFYALLLDKPSAYQVIHRDIKLDGGECEFLSDKDFE